MGTCILIIFRLWLYICSYCNWDTSVRKFAYAKESDLNMVIEQVKEHSNKGYLKKMYDSMMLKLKENEGLSVERNITHKYYFIIIIP